MLGIAKFESVTIMEMVKKQTLVHLQKQPIDLMIK